MAPKRIWSAVGIALLAALAMLDGFLIVVNLGEDPLQRFVSATPRPTSVTLSLVERQGSAPPGDALQQLMVEGPSPSPTPLPEELPAASAQGGTGGSDSEAAYVRPYIPPRTPTSPSNQTTASPPIAKANQTITFGSLGAPRVYRRDLAFPVTAGTSSGLPVTFAATGNCRIAGIMVTITGAGSCTVTASQGGDANYFAAPNAQQTVTIDKATQTIVFSPVTSKVYAPGGPSFGVNAVADSGLVPVTFSAEPRDVCTISGSTVIITGTGTCRVLAAQAGDANYERAVGRLPITIDKASQIVIFVGPVPSSITVPSSPFTVHATASSLLRVVFSSSGPLCRVELTTGTVTITGRPGKCSVTATQAGSSNYKPASSTRDITIT